MPAVFMSNHHASWKALGRKSDLHTFLVMAWLLRVSDSKSRMIILWATVVVCIQLWHALQILLYFFIQVTFAFFISTLTSTVQCAVIVLPSTMHAKLDWLIAIHAKINRLIDWLIDWLIDCHECKNCYRIVGNFREVQFFAIFLTHDQNAKIRTAKYQTAKIWTRGLWKFLPRAFCALVSLNLTSDDGTIALF